MQTTGLSTQCSQVLAVRPHYVEVHILYTGYNINILEVGQDPLHLRQVKRGPCATNRIGRSTND